jgi:glycosyltransferase involved in cell wall biosynthesis
MKASFLICGHNSRADLLERVVAACVGQEGLRGEDEILLVDSGSAPPLQVPAAYAGRVKLVREEQPGLARARVCGIRHSSGEMLVFVDDDTVLYPDYLARARRVLAERPYLAAIGGQLIPEFEGALPLPEHYYRERLAIREFQGDLWSNRWDDFATSPIGGGMVVRRIVADEWATLCETTPWRMAMGRSGTALTGGEDRDLVHTACQHGYGAGVFSNLKLTHVFPPHRLEPTFLVRITEGNSRSGTVLRALLNPSKPPPPDTLAHRVRVFLEGLRRRGLDRELWYAQDRGKRLGWHQALDVRKQLGKAEHVLP